MKKQDEKPREKFFGIDVAKDDSIDYQSIIAQMFMCPNLTPEHAVHYIAMLENDELSVERLLETIDDEMFQTAIYNDNSDEVMYDKLKDWEEKLGPMTEADKKYLFENFSFNESNLKIGDTTMEDNDSSFHSPKELAEIVQQGIKGQDDAINRLSVPIAMHDMCRRNGVPNIIRSILLMGDTGVGKSETIRLYGNIFNNKYPIIHVNSNEIVPMAWKGLHLSDLILNSMQSNGYTIEQMKYSIIMFHEFDKIVHYGQRLVGDRSTDQDNDMVRECMQLFETGRYLVLENGLNPQSYQPCRYNLPTDNLLIIFDGAFVGMENIIRKRLHLNQSLGFSRIQENSCEINNLMKEVTKDDLVTWGYLPELVGRIDEVVVMNKLTSDIIYEILTDAKDNIMQTHIKFCEQNSIKVEFTKEAIWMISNKAASSGLGFRDVRSSLSRIMTPIYFEHCGATSENTLTIVIDKEYVEKQLKNR